MSRKRKVLLTAGILVAVLIVAVIVNLRIPIAPNGYVSVTHDVAFYPACGNETLSHGGLTWYRISRGDWPTPSARALAASGGKGIGTALPMVAAPPGPGDDVGTLYVYAQGTAYWVSDSGDIDAWLTLIPQTYNWVC